MPVGMWVMRTAESVVFTLCPPGPEERKTSMRMSLSSILTSTSSASGSTATVAAEVWMRPWLSVAGTRWTRCTPDSQRIAPYAPSPCTLKITSLMPPSEPSEYESTSVRHPWRWMKRVYMRYRSAAKSAASSPPEAARVAHRRRVRQLRVDLGGAPQRFGEAIADAQLSFPALSFPALSLPAPY